MGQGGVLGSRSSDHLYPLYPRDWLSIPQTLRVSLHLQDNLLHSPYILWFDFLDSNPIICTCFLIHLPPTQEAVPSCCDSPCPTSSWAPIPVTSTPQLSTSQSQKAKLEFHPELPIEKSRESLNTQYQQTGTLYKSSPL